MSKTKTRVRVARIAAGAVFAAGASLAAAGTASAAGLGVDLGILQVGVNTDNGLNANVGVLNSNDDDDPSNPTAGTGDDPTNPTAGTGEDPTDPGGDNPTDPGDNDGTLPNGNDNGNGGGDNTCDLSESGVDCGNDNTEPKTGGSTPVEAPSSQQGTQNDAQGGAQTQPKDELAETGAAETTFLILGAATMIAGGVGFRVMPRVITRRTAA
jgi:hypothetical protein